MKKIEMKRKGRDEEDFEGIEPKETEKTFIVG
jgi:hypothetical protein